MKNFFGKQLILGLILMGMYSCQQDLFEPSFFQDNYFVKDIPADFDWATISSVQVSVTPDDQFDGGYYYIMGVYEQNPLTTSEAICYTQGVCKGKDSYSSTIVIPNTVKKVYVTQKSPAGKLLVSEIEISDNKVIADFRPEKAISTRAFAESGTGLINYNPDFNIPQNTVIIPDNAPSPLRLVKKTNYVINNFRGEIIFSGEGEENIYITGNCEITNSYLKLQHKTGFYVLNGANVSIAPDTYIEMVGNSVLAIEKGSVFNQQQLNCKIDYKNQGYFFLSGVANITTLNAHGGSTFVNESGTMLAGEISGQTSLKFRNNGAIAADVIYLNHATFENEYLLQAKTCTLKSGASSNTGKIVVENQLVLDMNHMNNQCHITAGQTSITNNAKLTCGTGTLVDAGKSKLEGSAVYLENGAIFQAKEILFDSWASQMFGSGSGYALIRTEKIIFPGWQCVQLKQNLEIEYQERQDATNGNGYFADKSVRWTRESELVIEKTDCNTDGNGGNPTPPVNPEFPIYIENNSVYTFVMEDNFPKLGDYDMNDLVMTIKSQTLAKESNGLISSIHYKMDITALGATRKTAFALQLNKNLISGLKEVTVKNSFLEGSSFEADANGFEINKDNIVIPLIGDCHALFNISDYKMVNTSNSEGMIPEVEIECTLVFNDPVAEEVLLVNNMNFFCISGTLSNGKRQETHMPGMPHSEKSDTQKEVVSTTSNLMWAMIIPGKFQYPTESVNLQRAYPQFERWVQSNKQENADWYLHPANNSNVVVKH